MTSYIPPGGTGICGPKEGSGLIYKLALKNGTAVSDNNADGAVDTADRVTALNSGGIPAEVVSLGGDKVLQPDLTVTDSGISGGFRSYWFQSDMDD